MAETLQNNGEVTDGDQEHLIPMSPEARERHTQFMAEQAAKLAEERAAYEQRREESLGRVEKSRARLRELFDDPTRECYRAIRTPRPVNMPRQVIPSSARDPSLHLPARA